MISTNTNADLASGEFVLLSGRRVAIRPIDPSDAAALVVVIDLIFFVYGCVCYHRSELLPPDVCCVGAWWAGMTGWVVLGIEESPITGPEGNKEFLIAARFAGTERLGNGL